MDGVLQCQDTLRSIDFLRARSAETSESPNHERVVQSIGNGLMTKLPAGFVRLACFLLVLIIATSAWVLIVTPAERRDRAKINSRGFEHITANTPWDLKKEMLWATLSQTDRDFLSIS